ncbi:M48 family metallopeptidase [Elioraea rosea]|uniref:M48 family metallopeptidase n=1 Tax=Elioraea rosea TaxID=2492390 RepID=UPI00118444BB|nr:SprT family zinc-dependent metalloprotease [Elioraea rosea]
MPRASTLRDASARPAFPLRAAPGPARETLALEHGAVEVEWRRSPRARRVTLRIDPTSGSVVVTLPMRAGRNQGVALLRAHADWVRERLAALSPRVPFIDGAIVPLLGRPHAIRHRPGAVGGVWLEGEEIHVSGDPSFLSRRVTAWLREHAKAEIAPRAAIHAGRIARRFARISIKDPRSRWASCAPDGTLAFSWRLVLTPPWVLDYVIAHEVAHLAEMNHGPRFWAAVARLTPHADAAKVWLAAHGQRLLRYG